MMTRKSIDTIQLSIAADKLPQRERDWIKLMKPMDTPPAMVASAILEHRHDTAALVCLKSFQLCGEKLHGGLPCAGNGITGGGAEGLLPAD